LLPVAHADFTAAQLFLVALNLALTLCAGLGAFVLKHVWTSLIELRVADDRLAERVAMVRSSVEENFVRTSALRDALDPFKAQLSRIEAKLDRKVDRSECVAVHSAAQVAMPNFHHHKRSNDDDLG